MQIFFYLSKHCNKEVSKSFRSFVSFLILDYFFYPVDKALLPTSNRSLKQCGLLESSRRLSALGILKILDPTQVCFP